MNDTKAPLYRNISGNYYPSPPFSEHATFSVPTPVIRQYVHHTNTNAYYCRLPNLNDSQQQQQFPHCRTQATAPVDTVQLKYGCETYFGFIKDRQDAILIVEACVQGQLKCMPVYKYTNFNFRSGSIVVITQKSYGITSSIRWRDGRHWTTSKLNEGFLLYRETAPLQKGFSSPQFPIEKFPLFTAGSLKSNTKLIPDGMAKRTISLTGSDGNWYRDSHYNTRQQRKSILKTPTEIPEFAVFGKQMRFSGKEIMKVAALTEASQPSLQFQSSSGCSCGGIKRLESLLRCDVWDHDVWFKQPLHLSPINRTQNENIN
ncbi:hypothetical protein HK100_001611 [Physocladia obscura]|uniref:Uncharacterized protein n=1 Tax=Physocladia obscura TaxID=109957 RepID=A0AAD5SZ41_9FUNG|nr:hypothetical protein HK100_001611 [Physocladia obscura]